MDSLVTTEWLAKELGANDLRIVDASYFLDARDARAEFEVQRFSFQDVTVAGHQEIVGIKAELLRTQSAAATELELQREVILSTQAEVTEEFETHRRAIPSVAESAKTELETLKAQAKEEFQRVRGEALAQAPQPQPQPAVPDPWHAAAQERRAPWQGQRYRTRALLELCGSSAWPGLYP